MPSPSKSFVSHSINYEDVLLRRIFAGRTTGFFVDVGAAHPIDDNDIHALSQLGWSGINVEPNPTFFRRLEAERPNDRNFNLAVSDREGTLDWFQVGETGLSTCDEAEAARAAEKGHAVTRHTVPTTTLARIFGDVAPEAIDLLKVDVEGLELDVLRGNDWDRWRPKLIVVEATLPESRERRTDRVGPFLTDHGYRHAHFDGLNDWFVEAAFAPPADAFLPPHVFDGFVTRRQAVLELEAEALAEQARTASEFAESVQERFRDSESYAVALKASLETMEDDVATSLAASADLQEEVRRLHAAVADAHEKESRQEARLADLQDELTRVHAAVADAHEKESRQEARLADLQDELTRVHAAVADAHEKESRQEARLADLQDELTRVHAAVADAHEKESRREARLADLQDELTRVHAAVADAHRREGRLQASLIDVQEDVGRSRAAASQAHDRYASMAVDFEAALQTIAESAAARAAADDLHRSDVAALQASLAATRAAADDLHRSDVARLQASLADAREALERAEASGIRVSQDADQLRREFESETEAMEALRSNLLHQRSALTAEMAKLQQDIIVRSERLSASEERACRAEARFRALEDSTSWRVTRPIRAVTRLVRRS